MTEELASGKGSGSGGITDTTDNGWLKPGWIEVTVICHQRGNDSKYLTCLPPAGTMPSSSGPYLRWGRGAMPPP